MSRAPERSLLLSRPIWRRVGLILALGLFLSGLLACLRSPASPQPATLTYEGPQAYTLKPGDPLPGTDIRYVGRTADGAEFTIGGQRAVKQKADSLNWAGSPASGVRLDLRLRIVWYTDEALYAAGTARLEISDVAPQAGEIPTEAPLSYQAPVTYGLEVGAQVPGSGIRYEGSTPDGAKFAGVEGYPYRRLADSVRWEGRLRPNVALRLDLRVLEYGEKSARLGGLAHLWVTP